VKEMRRVAERLHHKMAHCGPHWVLLNGGHLPADDVTDLLHDGDRMIALPGHRINTRNTHGSGCTLSAALAAILPQSIDVPEAAQRAKAYLTQAIRHAERLSVGTGHGPLHHLHAFW
jgi:hydroxymethylpyrimidine/phosphomethylpyrimidine kinase